MKINGNTYHVCGSREDHVGRARDDDDRPNKPEVVTCGGCGRSWCERCDPAPAALCHYCHGRGHSHAPIGNRQLKRMGLWPVRI